MLSNKMFKIGIILFIFLSLRTQREKTERIKDLRARCIGDGRKRFHRKEGERRQWEDTVIKIA